ncbi:MAG: hypothetical protein AAF840_08950, partial [Bacteroidota bacterium]
NFIVAISLLVVLILSLIHHTQAADKVPLSVVGFASGLLMLVIHFARRDQQKQYISEVSNKRSYLFRLAYHLVLSGGLLFTALMVSVQYSGNGVAMAISAGLAGLAIWLNKSPSRDQPFWGTNSLGNYWRRIGGGITFSQLDYVASDNVRFSYEDGLSRDGKRRYHVFLQRVKERQVEDDRHSYHWERIVLWSARQEATADLLSKGLSFYLPTEQKNKLEPKLYHLLYWEVIIQEVDGSFIERFLVGVQQRAHTPVKRREVLHDLPQLK